MNRRFRIISLTAEALSLELEDVLERDEIYEQEFKKSFHEEIRYLMIREAKNAAAQSQTLQAPEINLPGEDEIVQTDKPDHSPIVKELYRSLAKATHPDLHGDESEEEFKEIQNAYTENDLLTLITAANRNGIAPELDDAALDDMSEMISTQRSQIDEIKKTVRWQWAISDKTDEVRRLIMCSIGLVPTQFYSWKEAEEAKVRKAQRERREAHEKKMREAERRKKEARKRKARKGPNPTRKRDVERASRKAARR